MEHARRELEDIFDHEHVPWQECVLDHIYSETEGHPGHADNASQEEQQSLLNVAVRVGVNRLYEKLREQQEVTHAAN